MDMNKKYEKIIGLPHHVSTQFKRMPRQDRAAQFASFAALTGYEEAVRETARLTDCRPELSEDEKLNIDAYLKILRESIKSKPLAGITYFVPDTKKSGGKLVDVLAPAVEMDEKRIVFEDMTEVPIKDIVSVDPAFRSGFEFELY